MALDPSYRIHVSWNGQHFYLYVRSLIHGVLPQIESLISLDCPTEKIELKIPLGIVTTCAYQLSPAVLLDTLLSEADPHGLPGGDLLWLSSVARWLLGLFRDEYWYPDKDESGGIQLQLLLDSPQVKKQIALLQNSTPPSLWAALVEPMEANLSWKQVIAQLAQVIGWKLIRKEPIVLVEAAYMKLPIEYRHLLDTLLSGEISRPTQGDFFDRRQANLTLKQRLSGLAFRLIEPRGEGHTWQVRPQLQSLENPEKFVDALEAWAAPSSIPPELLPSQTPARLHLLREFGRALRFFPVLGASLASSPPGPLTYSDEEMASFLAKEAEVLRSYGYELIAPPGLTSAIVPHASLRLVESSRGKSGLDLHQLLDFQWELVVENTLLDPEQLEAWRENPNSLLFSHGRWFWVDPKKTLKLLKFVDKQPTAGTLLEAMQLAAEMSCLTLQYEGRLSPLDSEHRFQELLEPDNFSGQLRDYQRRGFSWLAFMQNLGLGACLADDMGLGKTVQTLALFCALKNEDQLTPTLLVCPTSVLGNWHREATRFAPELKVGMHHGERAKNLEVFQETLAELDILLTSYALLTRDQKLFLGTDWRLIVLDEAQQIKNPNSKVSKLSYKLNTESRIILTGTPVENRLQDLWTLFRFLQPELLGSKRRFQSRFANPIEKRGDTAAKRQLKRLVGPFILRRTKSDPQIAAELPPRVETTVECSLTPEQAQIYEAEVKEALSQVEGLKGFQRKGTILRLLTRLKQLCDHPALLEEKPDWDSSRSGKLHRLFEILKELSPTEGVLIFSQFTTMLDKLKVSLTEGLGEEILLLDGSTPREQRDQIVDRFQSGIGPRIFCISLKAGGVGLNLTRASSVIHFDRWWNPAVEAQATDRAHRIGQTSTVQVFKFVTLNTLEEQIARILEEKRSLMTNLIEDGDKWLTELNDAELSDLLLPTAATKEEVTI